MCNHLPLITELPDYNGNWNEYLEGIYSIFRNDFIDNTVLWNSKPVRIFLEKQYQEKERSFWHIISKGKDDSNREPDLRRCERISWVKELLMECTEECEDLLIWIKYHAKSKKNRTYIWCKEVNYMVVIEERKANYQLITAFVVNDYSASGYFKEYQKFKI
jgi:hypothetical protein